MLLRLQRIYLSMVPTCPMPSPKPHLQNKNAFTSILTMLSMYGGSNICYTLLWSQDKSFLFSRQCKATQNHRAYGKSTQTLFSRILAWNPRYTNHVYTLILSTASTASVLPYSNGKLMTLPLPPPKDILPTFFSTSSMTNCQSPWNAKAISICTMDL